MATFQVVDTIAPADTLPAGMNKVNTNFSYLASQTASEGASMIAVETGTFTANDVQAALEEIDASITGFATEADLASTSSGLGASMIGIYDAKGHFSSTTVEDTLAEIINRTSTAEFLPAGDLVYPYYVAQSNFQYDTATGRLTSVDAILGSTTYTMTMNYGGSNGELTTRVVTTSPSANTDTQTINYSGGKISSVSDWVRT